MLPALAYVPVDDVVGAFETLSDVLPAEAQSIVDYFEDTWIGRINRRGQRRPPTFAVESWNCYVAAVDGLAKTNNAVEGWHRAFMEVVRAHHPCIFKFISALKKEQSLNETKIQQYIAGEVGAPGRRRYRDCAQRIQTIVNDYENRDVLDYLRGLAQNYNF